MELASSHIIYLWLGASALMIFLEFSGISGVGLFFAGLGAATVAVLMTLGNLPPEAFDIQFAWFFGATAAWAVVLWKPLQRILRGPKDATGYSNMVGESAKVLHHALKPGQAGQVQWSGTIMQARLVEGAGEVPVNGTVIIVDMQGTTLLVKPA